jgi:hypothetical protein
VAQLERRNASKPAEVIGARILSARQHPVFVILVLCSRIRLRTDKKAFNVFTVHSSLLDTLEEVTSLMEFLSWNYGC